ncbi:MAG: phosphate/phosphite/phosphonate ABC transporter substrate-binding protein [Variibacter sp.]|nr:phosphate/phosphite/phosphonate ABC transporter substrate-binding protein [Variibacter sp.]
MRRGLAGIIALAAVFASAALPVAAQDACPNRGQLDTIYCDRDGDMVADTPTDPAKLKDPSTLIWAYTPVEDPAIYVNMLKPFVDHLTACTGRRTVHYAVQSNAAQIEAMRSGRLHMAGFSTGPTAFAVNLAGAVPFAAGGSQAGPRGYNLIAIVKADSPYKTLADLKGKKVAHTSLSSNSGNLAPRVLFPPQGLTPDQDYKPLMSGGHDKSILGVARGDYDMAAIASDVLDRMVSRGNVKAADFRILYTSEVFPTNGYVHAHDLKPELAAKIKECFFNYRFPPELQKEWNGEDRFVPINYKQHWSVVREVAEKTGAPFTRATYDKEEEERKRKQQQQPPAPPKP